jgi:hypothetical protein
MPFCLSTEGETVPHLKEVFANFAKRLPRMPAVLPDALVAFLPVRAQRHF